MHPEAYRFIAETIGYPTQVLEIGSLNINGSPRQLVPTAHWHGIDQQAGPDVDEIADAATWQSHERFDLIVCAEVLEHTPAIPQILATIHEHLIPDGKTIITCATTGRAPHSAIDGREVRTDEHYENVDPLQFLDLVHTIGLVPLRFETHHDRGDLYLLAVKPNG